MTNSRIKNIAYWAATILGPTSFVIGGILSLSQNEQAMAGLTHLGYPAYFGSLLGAWKLLGAIALTVPGLPRLKEWAYAGFAFDLTAAAFSHASVGDPTGDVVAPLVFLALVMASWALRPASRKLASTAVPERASTPQADAGFAGIPARV
jgi:hypothetical protein